MPKPVYILCAENVSIDQQTNLVSLFNVIEKIDISYFRDGAAPPPQQKLGIVGAKVVAVWSKVKGDDGKPFEAQIEIEATGGASLQTDVMSVAFSEDKLLQRIVLTIPQLPPMLESGILKISSRIRKKGARTWHFQAYEIPVNVTIHTPALPSKPKRRIE